MLLLMAQLGRNLFPEKGMCLLKAPKTWRQHTGAAGWQFSYSMEVAWVTEKRCKIYERLPVYLGLEKTAAIGKTSEIIPCNLIHIFRD